MPRTFYVYILASESRELYIGVTKNLARRLGQHREGSDPYRYVFRHQTTRLVLVETAGEARAAIERETELRGWTRLRKLALIERANPEWKDLAVAWRMA